MDSGCSLAEIVDCGREQKHSSEQREEWFFHGWPQMDSGCSLAEIVDCGCGLRPLSRLKPLPQFLEPLPGIPSRLKPLPQFLEPLPGILSRLKPLLQFLKPLPGVCRG